MILARGDLQLNEGFPFAKLLVGGTSRCLGQNQEGVAMLDAAAGQATVLIDQLMHECLRPEHT